MREFDDRYPEFAEAHAPVKRGKRYGGLTWSFFASACVFVLAVSILNLQIKAPSPVVPPVAPEPEIVEETEVPESVAITITLESQEEEYSGEEMEIVPGFSFTAADENGDATDSISVELNEDTVIRATDVGEYPFELDETAFTITAEEYENLTGEAYTE